MGSDNQYVSGAVHASGCPRQLFAVTECAGVVDQLYVVSLLSQRCFVAHTFCSWPARQATSSATVQSIRCAETTHPVLMHMLLPLKTHAARCMHLTSLHVAQQALEVDTNGQTHTLPPYAASIPCTIQQPLPCMHTRQRNATCLPPLPSTTSCTCCR
jgi:hypothetical protein